MTVHVVYTMLDCPFCGPDCEVSIEHSMHADPGYVDRNGRVVMDGYLHGYCGKCTCEGPPASSYAEAARFWNMRAGQDGEDAFHEMLRVLREAVAVYGKKGGPWNVPGDPGSWLDRARKAIEAADKCIVTPPGQV